MAPPQYGYASQPGPWSRLFDFSFQGFVTPSTLKVVYIIILALIGAYAVLSIIYGALLGGRFGVLSLFIALAVAAFLFFISRILFELMATVLRMRDNAQKDTGSKR